MVNFSVTEDNHGKRCALYDNLSYLTQKEMVAFGMFFEFHSGPGTKSG